MGYTKFGKIIRKEMIDHDENMTLLANLLNVSTPFVSAVLTGSKSIPDNWVDIISDHYDFNNEKYNSLYEAYCEDKKNIKLNVENYSLDKKKLVIEFQRKLTKLNDNDVNEINKILKGEK